MGTDVLHVTLFVRDFFLTFFSFFLSTHLVEDLNTHDQHIKTPIQSFHDDWAAYNDRGLFVTKRQLLQSAWEELKESDSLQAFQEAILIALPPPTTTVTQ